MFGLCVSHAAATHQPNNNSVLCVVTNSLVAQQYSLVATTHGALRATMFVVSLVCIEHSSSVILCLDCIECCIKSHMLRCPWLSSAFCTRYRQTDGNGLVLRLLCVAALSATPHDVYLPAHAERGVFGPAFAGYSCGYPYGYSKSYSSGAPQSLRRILRNPSPRKRRYCAPPVEVVAVGALTSFLCVCKQGLCCLHPQFRQKGRGEPPSHPHSVQCMGGLP